MNKETRERLATTLRDLSLSIVLPKDGDALHVAATVIEAEAPLSEEEFNTVVKDALKRMGQAAFHHLHGGDCGCMAFAQERCPYHAAEHFLISALKYREVKPSARETTAVTQLLDEWDRWKRGEVGRWTRVESMIRYIGRLRDLLSWSETN